MIAKFILAALAYGRDDVADVTTEEIKVVSVIWFGTVATIVATTGTVLALIPTFLETQKHLWSETFRLTRRFRRIFYLFFARFNRVLLSAFTVLTALTKLILSFAEIFRGLVGVPVQRAFRRALLAHRRRLNKPRLRLLKQRLRKLLKSRCQLKKLLK